jgi:hypothetical protein
VDRFLPRDRTKTYHLTVPFEVLRWSKPQADHVALPRRHRNRGFWKMAPGPRARTIVIRAEPGWAPRLGKDGSPIHKPRIGPVAISERRHRIVVSSHLINPPPHGACACVVMPISRVISLRRQLRGRAIYDGTVSPPPRRWP